MTGFDVIIVNNDSELILKGLNYWSEKNTFAKQLLARMKL